MLVLGLLGGLIALWALVAWQIAAGIAQERALDLIERERTAALHSAETIAANLRISFARLRVIPLILARKETLLEQLQHFGPDARPSPLPLAERQRQWRANPVLAALSAQWNELVANRDVGVQAIWLMNAAGEALATGVPPGVADFTGVSYGDREYFQPIRRGESGHAFAVGRMISVPSFFFTAPVMAGGRVLGAVGVRLNLSELIEQIGPTSFLTDDRGVIILARDPRLSLKVLPGGGVEQLSPAERLRRYKQSEFETLELRPLDGLEQRQVVTWPGSPTPRVLVRFPSDFVTVHVFRELPALALIQYDRGVTFLLLVISGAFLLVLLGGIGLYVVNSRRYNRTLARLNAELTHEASTDALTGCANRRHFLATLKAESQRCHRYGGTFTVLTLDLDHFKRINDRHGHPAGDLALRHFVKLVQSRLRAVDLLGRMGGEEFAVLLPRTDDQAALLVAQRICSTVAATPVPADSQVIALTVSIGAAQWRGSGGESLDELLVRADRALYQAKECGRNRVALSSPEPAIPPPPPPEEPIAAATAARLEPPLPRGPQECAGVGEGGVDLGQQAPPVFG